MRSCRHCGASFAPNAHRRDYCSETCAKAAPERTCQQCGKAFSVKAPAQRGLYCSNVCRGKAIHGRAILGAAAARRARGRLEVPCAFAACPSPDALLSVHRSRSGARHYHPECWQAYRQSGALRQKGSILTCQTCGGEIGYRMPSEQQQKYCIACWITMRKGKRGPRVQAPRLMRECPFCHAVVSCLPSMAARTATSFCSAEHYYAWRRMQHRTQVRCLRCGKERHYFPSALPLGVNRSTMTWTCLDCRSRKTTMRACTCQYCGKGFSARITFSAPSNRRFCTLACRQEHYRRRRRDRPGCQRCGQLIQRRGQHLRFCNWQCYTDAKQGRPNPHWHPSQAEQRVLEQWAAGVRGVRPLARAAWVSGNTVLKLKRAGRLVEPAAARTA